MGQDLASRVDAKVEAKPTGGRDIAALIKRQQAELERALPKHLDADRFARIVLTQIRRTPALMNCTDASLMASMMRLAQVGLEPDGRNAHLVPFGQECTPVIDYRGYMELARRSGQIATIYAHVAYASDDFEYELGLNPDIRHRPTDGERGPLTHAYAVAKFKDGGEAFVVLTEADISKRKGASKTAGRKGSMWVEWEDAAWRKTAVRALAAYLPYSPELQLADNTDKAIDDGRDFIEVDEMGPTAELETGES